MSITKSHFGDTADGRRVDAFLIENKNNMKIRVITLGATLQSIEVTEKSGKSIDILCGFDDVKGFEERHDYQGMIVGPVANRISAGGITIDGKKVTSPKPTVKTRSTATANFQRLYGTQSLPTPTA